MRPPPGGHLFLRSHHYLQAQCVKEIWIDFFTRLNFLAQLKSFGGYAMREIISQQHCISFENISTIGMFDLKVIESVLNQLEEERGVPRDKALDAIEQALATAYKKEYGKKGQIIRATFDPEDGKTEFLQVKIVVDESTAIMPGEEREGEDDDRVRFNPEHHILLEDARKIKKDAEVDEEIVFPLEDKEEYGRISAQTAKQVIIQKIREAEKSSVHSEFDDKQGEIVTGTVQRVERGNVFVDLGRATGILAYDEQIPGERFSQGQRVRAYLFNVDESSKGIFLRLSRSRPEFLESLFEMEAPEIANGVVEIKAIAREPGSRSKVAVTSHDDYVDPVGACVGQRGVRVSTVMSELGNEKIDIIEWSDNPGHFVEEALSPAEVLDVEVDEDEKTAVVTVAPDQQSLAIGKGGQNARLAAKLTGWKIDIRSAGDDEDAEELEVTPDDAGEDDIKTLINEDDNTDNDDEFDEQDTAANDTSDAEEAPDSEAPASKESESVEETPTDTDTSEEETDDDTENDGNNEKIGEEDEDEIEEEADDEDEGEEDSEKE